jgi:hypothetical protein
VMTEHDFVRNVVEGFANTSMVPTLLYGVGRQRPDGPDVQRMHERFCADLQAIIEGRVSAADRRRIFSTADRLVLVPRTDDDGTVKVQYLPESTESALGHALRLLLDPLKPYRNDLKQCQWKDCKLYSGYPGDIRRFFLVSDRRKAAAAAGKEGTGKLPDRYCCEEHMRAAHRARATEATIRRRNELRERKLGKNAKR